MERKTSYRSIAVLVALGCLLWNAYSLVLLDKEVDGLKNLLAKVEKEKLVEVRKVQFERENDLRKFGEILAEKDEHIAELEKRLDTASSVQVIRAEVTSYAPLDPNAVEGVCYSGDPSITATGTTVRMGVAAADFSKLPVGTVLDIPGYGIAIVEDTGSALRKHEGYAIDVFLPTREEALAWGRQQLNVKILYMPDN